MAEVRLDGVGVTFDDGFTALHEVDLHVADGEFVCLIGPSGSGKTTLLRTIAGFLRPSAGSVHIGDLEVASAARALPPEQRRLGMVFQQHAIWPHLSVGKNVAYPLRFTDLTRDQVRERVGEVLRMVGLEDLADRSPARLSGGQRQRVALARALAPSPRVLLLDEALSALDEPLRDQLRVELTALTRRMGLTVVHVTHDRDEALALADRIAVMDGGRIQQVGTPAQLLARPATSFVATFLSDASLFPGVLGAGGFTATDHPLRLSAAQVEVAGAAEVTQDGERVDTARALAARESAAREGESAAGEVRPQPQEGLLAVLPQDVHLHEAASDGDEAPGAGGAQSRARVTSALFGRAASDVVLDWAGHPVRSESPWRPRIEDHVDVEITRGIFYPTSR